MKLFGPLYRWVLTLSRHRHAERYLAGISFFESSVFPVPTALMLAPMVLAQRHRAWRLAVVATLTSVLGGMFGYFLGYALFEQVGRAILSFYQADTAFALVQAQFLEYGVWLVLLTGLTPIPYKLCTIASGVIGLPIMPFVIGSLLGRASQFFLIAGALRWGGPKIEPVLEKWIEWIGWTLLVSAAMAYFLLRHGPSAA